MVRNFPKLNINNIIIYKYNLKMYKNIHKK